LYRRNLISFYPVLRIRDVYPGSRSDHFLSSRILVVKKHRIRIRNTAFTLSEVYFSISRNLERNTMVVAPLEQQKSTVSNEDDLSLVDSSGKKRSSPAFVTPCSDSPLTCTSGQPTKQTVDLNQSSASTSQSTAVAAAAVGQLSSAGVKRRRESSVSSGSSSDEGASFCKKRFLSHREYKGRRGSPLADRRARLRRRSSSCSSSPDRRNGPRHTVYTSILLYFHLL
jgi:hypothetical protein